MHRHLLGYKASCLPQAATKTSAGPESAVGRMVQQPLYRPATSASLQCTLLKRYAYKNDTKEHSEKGERSLEILRKEDLALEGDMIWNVETGFIGVGGARSCSRMKSSWFQRPRLKAQAHSTRSSISYYWPTVSLFFCIYSQQYTCTTVWPSGQLWTYQITERNDNLCKGFSPLGTGVTRTSRHPIPLSHTFPGTKHLVHQGAFTR